MEGGSARAPDFEATQRLLRPHKCVSARREKKPRREEDKEKERRRDGDDRTARQHTTSVSTRPITIQDTQPNDNDHAQALSSSARHMIQARRQQEATLLARGPGADFEELVVDVGAAELLGEQHARAGAAQLSKGQQQL